MGADLFGSYVATVLAAMVLGNYLVLGEGYNDAFGGLATMLLPLYLGCRDHLFLHRRTFCSSKRRL